MNRLQHAFGLGALVLASQGILAAKHDIETKETNRDIAVCKTLAEGQELTRAQMPKVLPGEALGNPYLPGNTLDEQMKLCGDKFKITMTRDNAAKSIRATLAGDNETVVPKLLRIEALREIEAAGPRQ